MDSQFLASDGGKRAFRELERYERGKMLLNNGKVSTWALKIFHKYARATFLMLLPDLSLERRRAGLIIRQGWSA